jgi:hypothetical protein
MLNRGALNIDGSGGIVAADVAGGASTNFNGGTPTKANGSIVTTTASPTDVIGGLPYNAGSLCIENNGVIVSTVAGIPITAAQKVATATDKPAVVWNSGLPFNVDGRLFISATPG